MYVHAPLTFPPTPIPPKMGEQAADVGILRSGVQEDERHQPKRNLPL